MKKKILILISCLSASGISFFTWRIFAHHPRSSSADSQKLEKEKVVNYKKANKSPFLIVIDIIIFLIIVGIFIWILNKNKKNDQNHNNHKKTNTLSQDEILKKYENFEYGLIIEEQKIKIILCQKFDQDQFFEQLWKLDIENQINKNMPQFLKEKCNDLLKNKKDEIKNFFKNCMNILTFVKKNIFNSSKKPSDMLKILSKITYGFAEKDLKYSTHNEIIVDDIKIDVDFVELTSISDDEKDKNYFMHNDSLILLKSALNKTILFFYDQQKNEKNVFFLHLSSFYKTIIKQLSLEIDVYLRGFEIVSLSKEFKKLSKPIEEFLKISPQKTSKKL